MYQALYRKWRPRTFDEVVGQPHVTETLKRQLETDRISHAYLFIGTRGTGKTSCAKILSKAVNCEQPVNGNPCNSCPACQGIDSGSILDVEELDAASNNGVDHVRALRDEAIFTPASVKKRVYIIDEVHMLSTAAFNALLKIMEEPPAHLIFILATTEVHKVPATILSRCQRYAFKRVSPTDVAGRLRYVAQQENLELLEDAGALLARLADGSMRDALALLDQCAMGKPIDTELVLSVVGLTGHTKTAELLTAIGSQNVESALALINDLYFSGKDMGSLINELSTLLRDILLTRIAPKGSSNLLSGSFDTATLTGFSHMTPERLLSALNQTTAAGADMARSANRKLVAELCVIRLCDDRLSEDVSALGARVAQLEQQIRSGVRTASVQAVQAAVTPVTQPQAPVQPVAEPISIPTAPAQDAPPWDTPDTAPVQEPEPESAVIPVSVPAAAAPVVTAPSGSDDIWPKILAAVESNIDFSIFTLISDGKEVKARLESGSLDIYIENEFTKAMAESQEVTNQLRDAAAALSGGPVVIKFHSGSPPALAPSSKLDALSKFDNITFK